MTQPVDPKTVTLSPPPAPEIDPHSVPSHKIYEATESDYSVFPSVYPRIWSPLLGVEANGVAVGATVFGFDAIDVQRYMVAGSYNTNLQVSDWNLLYSNRTLGPSLNVQANYTTTYIQLFREAPPLIPAS